MQPTEVMRVWWSCYWNLEQISRLRMKTIWMWWTWLWDRETKSVCSTQNIERFLFRSIWDWASVSETLITICKTRQSSIVCCIELHSFSFQFSKLLNDTCCHYLNDCASEKVQQKLHSWVWFMLWLAIIHHLQKQTAPWVRLLDRFKTR